MTQLPPIIVSSCALATAVAYQVDTLQPAKERSQLCRVPWLLPQQYQLWRPRKRRSNLSFTTTLRVQVQLATLLTDTHSLASVPPVNRHS